MELIIILFDEGAIKDKPIKALPANELFICSLATPVSFLTFKGLQNLLTNSIDHSRVNIV